MEKFYKINSEEITYRIVDNEAVILNLKTGKYYSLNETATFIFKLLAAKTVTSEIIDRIAEEFEINKDNASADLKALIKDLTAEKIVTNC